MQKYSIVLVEDDVDHAILAERYVRAALGEATEVRHFQQLQPALACLENNHVDAALVDLRLEESDLNETLQSVLGANHGAAVIVLTSLDDVETAVAAVQQGAQDYLVKSHLDVHILRRSIRHAVERKKVLDELQDSAAKLQRSNEELKWFAHTLAHEVRNPLNLISLLIDFLDDQISSGETIRIEELSEIVDEARTSVAGLNALVTDLLKFTEVSSAASVRSQIDLEHVFSEAVAALRPSVESTNATVTHDDLPVVQGNEVQLRHLFQNLLDNAIKYRGDLPPEIHVAVKGMPEEFLFSVSDNGTGIEPGDLNRVFEMCVRVHDPQKYPGSGIGLAFCKRIVEEHGGLLWADSVPGAGSTFAFTLPRLRRDASGED